MKMDDDHVILGPQPVIDAGSGRCFWRASTHPDQEMAKTGKRQREVGGGGSGGGKKKGGGPGQGSGGGGAGAGLELPGACVCLFSSFAWCDGDCPQPRSSGDGRQEQRTRQWHTTESGDVILWRGSVFQARPWAWERESVRLYVS